MANGIDWNDYGTPVATEDPPQEVVQQPQSQGINWNDYGTPVDQTQDQPVEQPQTDYQAQAEEAQRKAQEDADAAAAQQAKLDQIARTRAKLQAEDAARASRAVPAPKSVNQAVSSVGQGFASPPNDPNYLNPAEEALLGAAQGATGVGAQVGGLVRAIGARETGKTITDYWQEQAKQYQDAGHADPTATTGKMINWLASSAVGMAPIVVGGAIAGPRGVAAVMGLQSFGSTYNAAIDRYQQDGASESDAAHKAYVPAILAGAVSAAIGHAVGPTGLGALGSKALAGNTIRQIVGTIAKDMGLGAAQGFTDTLAQGIIAKATYAPDRTWAEIVPDALESAGGGAVLGGLASGAHQGLGVLSRQATAVPESTGNQQVAVENASEQTQTAVQSDQPRVINPAIQTPETPIAQAPNVVNAGFQAPEAQGQPPNTVRFYHGGANSGGGNDPRWVTPYLEYARGYADKSAVSGKVFYVDIPKDSPLLRKAYDDSGGVTPAPYLAFEAPAEVMAGAKEYKPSAVPAVVKLPKIDVPEALAPALTEAIRVNPLGLDQLVNKVVANHPIAPYYDQLPDSIDTSTPQGIAEAQRAIAGVAAKIEASDLAPEQKTAAIKPLTDIQSGFEKLLPTDISRPPMGFEQVPQPAQFNSVDEMLNFRQQRLAEERQLYQNVIGLSPEQATKLQTIMTREGDTGKFEKTLTPELQKKLTWFFDESSYNKRGDAFQSWETNKRFNPEELTHETDHNFLARSLINALDTPLEPKINDDRFLYAAIAAMRLRDTGATLKDLAGAARDYARSNSGSAGDAKFMIERSAGKLAQFLQSQGIQLLETPRTRLNESLTQNAPEAVAPAQSPAVEHPIGLRQEAGSGAKADIARANPANGTVPPTTADAELPATPAEAQPAAGREPVRSVASAIERPPDIIYHIVDNYGLILSKSASRKGMEGYYGDMYTSVRNSRPRLFSDKGQSPDRIVDNLRRDGIVGQDFTVDDLWDAIDKSHKARTAFFKGQLPEQKQEKFHRALIEAANSRKHYTVSVGDLEVGTKFKIQGEPFVVKNIDPDTGEVQVDDGSKFGHQVIPDGADIPVQKGSLKKVKALTPEQAWNAPVVESSTVPTLRPGEKQGDLMAKQQEDFALVGQKGTDYEAIQKAKAQAEADRAASAKGQSDMFKASLATQPPVASARPDITATGKEAIARLLADPNNGLDPDAIKLAQALHDDPKLGKLLEGRTLKLADTLEGDPLMAGYADIKKMIIGLSRSADPEVFVHEAMHPAWEGLPERDKAALEAQRQQLLKAAYGEIIPPRMAEGMTSAEFVAANAPISLYHLSNAEELMMWLASRKFSEKVLNPETVTIISRIKDWINAVIDVVKKALGKPPTWEQSVRNLLDGKFESSPELRARAEEGIRKASFVQTGQEAENAAKLARDAEDRAVEGRHFLAQTFDLHAALIRNGLATASDKAKRLLGLADKEAIVRKGIDLHGAAEGYREIKAKTPEPDAQLRNARFAAASFEAADQNQREIEAKRDEALAEVSKPSFVKKLNASSLAQLKAETMDQAIQTAKSVLSTKLTLAKSLGQEKGLSDLERATLQGQLKEVTEAQRSSSALSGLVSDMTKALASTPEGMKLLENGGSREAIQRVYRDLKVSTGQPLHSESLLNWASYLLEKAPELRQKLLATELASDPTIRAGMNDFEKKFIAAYEKDPVKAVTAEFTKATVLAGNAAKAKFAWKIINEPLIRAVKNFVETNQAAEIGRKALNSPEIVDLRKEIRTDAKFIGDQAHLGARIFDPNSTVISPSGRSVDLSGKEFGTNFQKLRTEAVAIDREIAEHLATAEPGTANYRYYERARKTLNETLLSGSALKNNDPLKVGFHTFGILRNVAYTSGGKISNIWKNSLAKAEQMSQHAQHWTTKWNAETNAKRIAAINSVKIKFGLLRNMNFARANDSIWPELNEIAWSGNRQSGALEVGDRVGTAGRTITKEYIAAVKSQKDAAAEGFNVSGDDQTTRDTLAGSKATFERGAHQTGVYGVPRTPEPDAAGFAQDMGVGYKAFIEAKQAADEPAQTVALGKMEKAFSDVFGRAAKSMTQDREFEIVGNNVTPLDGEGGAFDVVWPKIEDGTIQSAPEYFKALAEASGYSVPEVKAIVLPEFGRMADKWNDRYQQEEAARTAPGMGHETKNAFSRSRNEAVAPYWMYRYGFKDGNALQAFGGSIYARAFDAARNGLTALVKDMERIQLERDKKIVAERSKGNYNAKKTVEAQQRRDRDNDASLDDYYGIAKRVRLAQDMAQRLDRHDIMTTPEGLVMRGFRNIIGSALGSMAALGDIAQNPFYVGRSVLRVQGGYGKAAYLTVASHIDSHLRSIASGVTSSIKGLLNLILADPGDTISGAGHDTGMLSGGIIGALSKIPKDKSLMMFAHRAIMPLIQELTDDFHTRMWSYEKMKEHGIDPESRVAQDISNRILGGLAEAGRLTGDPADSKNPVSQVLHGLMGAYEVGYKVLSGSAYRMNDTMVNQTIRNIYTGYLGSRLGPIPQWQKAAKKFSVRVAEGRRQWNKADFADPMNEPSPKEMTGVMYAGPKAKLNMIDAHDRAGIDFRRKFFDAVNANLAGNGKHEMYSEADIYKLIQEMALYENKQSKINESQLLKTNSVPGLLIKQYQSWATRQFSNFFKLTETAVAATEGKKGAQATLARMLAYTGVAMNLVALLAGGALAKVSWDMYRRPLQKAMFNQVSANKLPWEYQGPGGEAKGWLLAAANSIPYIGNVANAMFDDLPSRAAYDPAVAAVEKGKTIGQYIGGAIQSGDPTYRLPETIGSLIPDTKAVLNRLESQSGKRENINAANLERRYADPDTLKPISGSNYPVTPLTPYGARMVNAAINGDFGKLQQIRDEAIQKAAEMGKADPEKSVEAMYRAQLYETKALKEKPSPEQRDQFLEKLSPVDRAVIDRVEGNYNQGAQAIGMSEPSLVKREPGAGGGVSRRMTVGAAALGGLSRGPRVKGLSGIKRARIARGRGRRTARRGSTRGVSRYA